MIFSREEIMAASLNKIRGAHLRGLGIVARLKHGKFLALSTLVPVAVIFAAELSSQCKYPAAPISDQIDDYSGTKVADPYRPLENPDAPETRKWIEAYNKISSDLL